MAETEIQILIKAVDEVSTTMKNIERQITKSGENIQKETKLTTEAFQKQVKSLVILGNAAQTANNIFDSYENMQMRLENAAERVTGAQDRLANAQYELGKVQKDSASTAEDLAEAQRQVDSASRGLTISQNNLARANNKVLDTYIQMGIQAGTLIAMNPILGLSMIALFGAVKLYEGSQNAANEALAEYNRLQELARQYTEESSSAYSAAIQDNVMYSQAVQTVKTEEKRLYDEMEASRKRQREFESLGQKDRVKEEQDYRKELMTSVKDIKENYADKVNAEYQKLHNEYMKMREAEIGIVMRALQAEYDLQKARYTRSTWMTDPVGAALNIVNPPKTPPKTGHDFIITKRGEFIQTDPNDTIFASKSGMGGGINLTITDNNIYGTDPDEIAEALMDKLRMRVAI